MKITKIIIVTLALSAIISNNSFCALYTVFNHGTEPVTVKITHDENENAFGLRGTLTLTAPKLKPNESTKLKLDAHEGNNDYYIQLFSAKDLKSLALANRSNSYGNTLHVKFDSGSDYTISLTNNKGLWSIATSKTK